VFLQIEQGVWIVKICKHWEISSRTISVSHCLLRRVTTKGRISFLGQLQPETDDFVQEYVPVESKKPLLMVKIRFQIAPSTEDLLYDYLIDPN